MADIQIKLDIAGFEKLTKKACDGAAKKGADKVLGDSKKYLMSKAAHPTGKLAGEIKLVQSKFEGGGYAVEAQGPGNYDRFYATFVELGSIRNPRPIPYLRVPLKAATNFIKGLFKDLV